MSEKLDKIVTVMQEVARDCEADARRTEGMALTGRNMGEMFGSTLAMIAAVARAVELLAEQDASIARVLESRTADLA